MVFDEIDLRVEVNVTDFDLELYARNVDLVPPMTQKLQDNNFLKGQVRKYSCHGTIRETDALGYILLHIFKNYN